MKLRAQTLEMWRTAHEIISKFVFCLIGCLLGWLAGWLTGWQVGWYFEIWSCFWRNELFAFIQIFSVTFVIMLLWRMVLTADS